MVGSHIDYNVFTLKEFLACKNDSGSGRALYHFADMMGIKDCENLQGEDLIMKILTWIIESDYLFYSMAVFDDDQIDLFNRSFREGFSCPDSKSKESDFAICLETLWLGTTYNDFTAFKIYPEISGGWNRVSQEKFDSYRKKASWVWKCFQWSGTFYKIVPVSKMLKLVHINKDVHITKGNLMDIYRHFPKALGRCYEQWMLLEDDCFVCYVCLGDKLQNSKEDKEEIQNLKQRQGKKKFYLPTWDEIELFNSNHYEYFLFRESYQKYGEYLEKELGVSKEAVYSILSYVNTFARKPRDFHYNMVLQDFLKDRWKIRFWSDKQVIKAAELFIEVINGTRMSVNRGYAPEELYRTNGIRHKTEVFEAKTIFYRASALNQVRKIGNHFKNEELDITGEGKLSLKLQVDLENGHLFIMDKDIQ